MSALRDALRELPEAVFADLLESEEAYMLVIDLPGATADTVDVRVESGRLLVEAQRAKDVPVEFEYVEEERALFLDVELPLPPNVTGDGATGTVDNGVLALRLPKRTAEASEPIPIENA